jgi:hypothetical protein
MSIANSVEYTFVKEIVFLHLTLDEATQLVMHKKALVGG